MSLEIFLALILLCTSVCGQLQSEFIRRNGLPQEEFNYVQSKLQELNNVVGRSVGIKARDLNSDEVKANNRQDEILYTREQMDFLINFYKKPKNSGTALGEGRPPSEPAIKPKRKPKRGKKKGKGRKGKKGRGKRKIVDFDLYKAKRWQLPIIYTVDSTFPNEKQQMISDAVAHWEEHTCLRFQKIADENADITEPYFHFTNTAPCASHVGQIPIRKAGRGTDCNKCIKCRCPQLIYGNHCPSVGTFVHEIGHTIGFSHEQTRVDRDVFIHITWENVGCHLINFAKQPFTRTYNIPYDVGSIMHYSGYACAINANQLVIRSKNPLLQKVMGQRAGLSFYDQQIANLEYCSDVCQRPLPCKRGGFMNPNDCSKCVCPDGFGGKLCEEVGQSSPNCPDVPAEIFLDDTEEKCTDFSPSSGGVYQCNLRIHTRKGWKIQVHKQTVDIEDCYGTHCCLAWVEFKHQHNLQSTGARYCGRETKTDKIVSESNEVMIVLKNNKPSSRGTVKFCYRAVSDTNTKEATTKPPVTSGDLTKPPVTSGDLLGQTGDFKMFKDMECHHNTIDVVKVPDAESCINVCRNNPKCVAVVHRFNVGRCTVKSQCLESDLARAPVAVTYMKPVPKPVTTPRPGDFKMFKDMECHRHDIKVVQAPDAESCINVCRNNPKCVAVVYRFNVGRCTLKSQCLESALRRAPVAVTYLKPK